MNSEYLFCIANYWNRLDRKIREYGVRNKGFNKVSQRVLQIYFTELLINVRLKNILTSKFVRKTYLFLTGIP